MADWRTAPIPPRNHRCVGVHEYVLTGAPHILIQRCACGAARTLDTLGRRLVVGPWVGRNSRRAAPENRKPYRRPWWLKILKKAGL